MQKKKKCFGSKLLPSAGDKQLILRNKFNKYNIQILINRPRVKLPNIYEKINSNK